METETIWEFPCWLCQQILGVQGPRVLMWLQCQWFSKSTHIHICCTIVCDLQDRQLFSVSLFSEKVKDLFPEGSFSSSTKLVLINTVYFKGLWDREFNKEHTKEEEFWLNKVWFFIYVSAYFWNVQSKVIWPNGYSVAQTLWLYYFQELLGCHMIFLMFLSLTICCRTQVNLFRWWLSAAPSVSPS